MRQFDVFVFDENFDEAQGKISQPPFTDPELGWFFTNDWNKHLNEIEGEWVVFAHPSIKIDRTFLNNVAEVTEGFPMVDAFAPRIRIKSNVYQESHADLNKNNVIIDKIKFLGGYLLRPTAKGSGFIEIDENAPMRYVAAPHPYLGIYSRRIIQRTGGFDITLPPTARLADFTLRMMHAGGKMFSVPYLVAQIKDDGAKANASESDAKPNAENSSKVTASENTQGESAPDLTKCAPDLKATAIILSKTFGIEASLPFALHHPSVIPTLFRNRSAIKAKRKAATLLSKLKADFLKEVVGG
ncbi:MAG: hypothetical protein IJM92_07475 [Fibrobacter sp.]|uniref:hypothetical protein n=1 Tax=Fibrobacter sp. TaxID=35828 RepID=UPI0025C2F81F|nr:hypothetical protein [Fibrobacter sp.]MBQ7079492.1 hypothetical protein [Fibrobacter sp.]